MAICRPVKGCAEVAQLVLLMFSTIIWLLSSLAGIVLYAVFIRGLDLLFYGFTTPCWLFGIAGLIFHVTAIVYLFTKNRVLKGFSDFFFIVYIVGAGATLCLLGYTFYAGAGLHLIGTVIFFLGALASVIIQTAFFILQHQQMISSSQYQDHTQSVSPPPYGQLQNMSTNETAGYTEKY